MANKVKITNAQGTQVFPITHVTAVIDNNGNSVEQVLGAQTDLIQQAQLEIGAVPSDLIPTEGSSNWVTSGGVYTALDNLSVEMLDKASVVKTVTISDTTTIATGYMVNDTTYLQYSGYNICVLDVRDFIGKIRVTSNTEISRMAFMTSYNTPANNASLGTFATGYSSRVVQTASTTEMYDIDASCNYIMFTYKTTSDNAFPTSITLYDYIKESVEQFDDTKYIYGEPIKLVATYGRRAAYPQSTWNDEYYSVFVPVVATEQYAIKASSQTLTISMLSSSDYTIGQAPTNIIEKVSVPASSEVIVTIPSSAVYMLICVQNISNQTDYTPEYVKRYYLYNDAIASNISKNSYIAERAVSVIEPSNENIPGVIGVSGKWVSVSSSGNKSGEYKISVGETYKVTAPPSKPSVLRWLTASDTSHSLNASAPVSNKCGQIVVPAGESVMLTPPSDAVVLNYVALNNSEPRQPKVEVVGTQNASENLMRQIPKAGCGTMMVSRREDTYTHAPIILENTDYRFVVYQGSKFVTIEDGVGETYSHIMLVYNKKANTTKYVNVFDCESPDTIDGYQCSIYYNETAIILNGTNTVLVRTGCHWNNKWVQVYKTYNADTDTISSADFQELSYGGSDYDFTFANYITMLNTLYSAGLTVIEERYTNQINNICYYDGYYYCVYAMVTKSGSSSGNVVPHIFAKSSDCVTWEPVANLFSDYTSETQIVIVNSKVYYVYRALSEGSFYAVFDLTGTILKASERLSTVASKPTIVYDGMHGKVVIGYNDLLGNVANRIKMTLAEISQSNYAVSVIKSYINSNGWNYFFFAAKANGNILSVSVEDSRQLNNGQIDAKTTTDVRIEEIDMFEVLNSD